MTMSELDAIPVVVEGQSNGDSCTEHLAPQLLQIEQDLQDSGANTVIDLAAMPFSSRDEEDLRLLGACAAERGGSASSPFRLAPALVLVA